MTFIYRRISHYIHKNTNQITVIKMAGNDKKTKKPVDDSKSFECLIKDTETVDGHTKYIIEVWRVPDSEIKWLVRHRYSNFVQLHSMLLAYTTKIPDLPPKKMFGNMDPEFIDDRKEALQDYLDEMVCNYTIGNSMCLRMFLDPLNYSQTSMSEEARQHVHTALRCGEIPLSHDGMELLDGVGTRLRKHFFRCHARDGREERVVWWLPYGPDWVGTVEEVTCALDVLSQCQHPFIVPAIHSVATENGICVVQRWFPQGSIRDIIYGAKPQAHNLTKYCGRTGTIFRMSECAMFGLQILHALSFLHDKGIGYGHLHSGNIILDNGICRLIDLENQVAGQPHLRRSAMTHLKKVSSPAILDIYAFGHVLYEMACGRPLLADTCSTLPAECPLLCRMVLESIMSPEACRTGLPTVADLLMHPFFSNMTCNVVHWPHLRFPSGSKQALSSYHEAILTRLISDQKKIRQQGKMAKIEAVARHRAARR